MPVGDREGCFTTGQERFVRMHMLGIARFTREILFDEKTGGTVHMALGARYPETGSQNQSAVHWDLICDLRQVGRVEVDGQPFLVGGQFCVKQ